MALLDGHGQPVIRYGAKRIQDRDMDELIGICRGIIADEVVVEQEARFLLRWLNKRRESIDTWHGQLLYDRVKEYLSDGVWSADEQKNFSQLVKKFVGVDGRDPVEAGRSCQLPVDNPQPEIIFQEKVFVATGKFATGLRPKVEAMIKARGGEVKSGVSKKINYLVIGDFSSKDWIHTSYGRKIERAAELREQGAPISIVNEEHWYLACASCESPAGLP
jgi:NAD-dependent DNA ligase